jgi:hypothetical protein
MRDTPIHTGWRKGGSLVAGGGVAGGGGSADLSRSTRRDITWPNLRRCLRHRLHRSGFSISQDDLGKTKQALGLGAAYLGLVLTKTDQDILLDKFRRLLDDNL